MNTQIIILTILAPAITGLAFIAYKHPIGFRKIAFGLGIIISLILTVIFAYNYGTMLANINFLNDQILTTKNVDDFIFSINSLNESKNTINVAFVIYIISMIYLTFLYFLPNILGITTDKPKTSTEIKKQKNGGN
ncbi:MAG: hypothetical protein IIA48_10890 [Bacteroidetes bacterium]|nr:hypothetical protein [Bacteroidota bacterium]MCH8942927.1 hypothetical protein [Bacteroidota bacterium]